MNLSKPRGTVRVAYRRMWNPSVSGIESRDGIARQRLRRASSGWILLLLLLLFLPAVAHAHLDYLVIDGSVTITGHRGTGGDVVIPDTINGLPVTRIGERAWWFNVVSVTIPDSVVSIGESAFQGWTTLASVTIGNGVTSIGDRAFSGCTGLTSISIPSGVTRIGDGAFCSCTGLTGVTIPDSVTGIGDEAFASCNGLTNVRIPDSVTRIGGGRSFSAPA